MQVKKFKSGRCPHCLLDKKVLINKFQQLDVDNSYAISKAVEYIESGYNDPNADEFDEDDDEVVEKEKKVLIPDEKKVSKQQPYYPTKQ